MLNKNVLVSIYLFGLFLANTQCQISSQQLSLAKGLLQFFTDIQNENGAQRVINQINLITHNDTLCKSQFTEIIVSVLSGQMWAIKMLDAWGKLPAGILTGNIWELGQFDQCMKVEQNMTDTSLMKGQYCLVPIRFQDDVMTKISQLPPGFGDVLPDINMATCVPSSCSLEMVPIVLNAVLNEYNIVVQEVDDLSLYCTSKDEPNRYSGLDIFAM